MKFVKLIFGLVLMCSFYASAEDVRIFYFTTSDGAEIRVAVEKDLGGRVGYTLFVSEQSSPVYAFRELVRSTLAGENYYYVMEKPCADCHVSLGTKPEVGIAAGPAKPVMKKTKLSSKTDIANTVIEGAALQVGSRSVDAVAGALQKDKVEDSQFHILLHTAYGKPTTMCVVTALDCEMLTDVTVTNMGGGGLGFLVENAGLDQWDRFNQIVQAIMRYTKSKGYKCRMSYTGSGDNMVAQMVCYPSH